MLWLIIFKGEFIRMLGGVMSLALKPLSNAVFQAHEGRQIRTGESCVRHPGLENNPSPKTLRGSDDTHTLNVYTTQELG